jgi:hypothetical protein
MKLSSSATCGRYAVTFARGGDCHPRQVAIPTPSPEVCFFIERTFVHYKQRFLIATIAFGDCVLIL